MYKNQVVAIRNATINGLCTIVPVLLSFPGSVRVV
jgi:hypothetical protein